MPSLLRRTRCSSLSMKLLSRRGRKHGDMPWPSDAQSIRGVLRDWAMNPNAKETTATGQWPRGGCGVLDVCGSAATGAAGRVRTRVAAVARGVLRRSTGTSAEHRPHQHCGKDDCGKEL